MINGVGNTLQNILENGAEVLKEAIRDMKDRMRDPAYHRMKLFEKQWMNTTVANVPAIKEVGGLGVSARLPNARTPRLPYFSRNVFWVQVSPPLPEHRKHVYFDSVCVWHNKLVFLFATHGVLV